VLNATIFSIVIFWALDLQGSFFVFAFIYYLAAMCGICLAYAIAAVAPNMEAANALLPTYVTTCMYFGGLFIIYSKIPAGWYWYSFTSFLRYAWGALLLNQYQDSAVGQAKFFYDSNGNAKTVLEFYACDTGIMKDMWGCIGVLAGMVGIFACLGALGVTFVSHVKR
jgi:ATP-binding cassette subfamily G (WHITE) protein 2